MTDPVTAPAAGHGLGVGKALAEARHAQGLAIGDVAQQLKFMPRQLEAIEQERFTSLPGPTIARGMVRTYARFLKLDPDPLMAAMAGHVDVPDATPQLAARFSQPVPFSDSGRRSTLTYLALSAVVLGIAAAVVHEWRQEREMPQFVVAANDPAPAPAAPVSAPPPAQTASNAPVAIPAAPAPLDPLKPEAFKPKAADAPKAEKPKSEPARSETAKPEETTLASAAPEPGAPKSIGRHRIVFRFDEEAWIEVTDGAGRLLASSLNPAGSERVLTGTPPFNLVIGNASNVKLRYDDRDVDLQPHVRVEVARFTLK